MTYRTNSHAKDRMLVRSNNYLSSEKQKIYPVKPTLRLSDVEITFNLSYDNFIGGTGMPAHGINHLSVSSEDIETSVRFYEDMFAMTRIPTYNFGFRTQYLRCGDQQLHVFELRDAKTRYQHFAINVDDFMAVYDKASAAGILDGEAFGNAVNEMPDGSVQMYLRDPGGNLVEVNWPDATTLDRARIKELKRLADRHEQRGENLEATLYLNRNQAS
jgi:catechol 2,3-dioxygenase-like lactoylglutathione lyase family enzyme